MEEYLVPTQDAQAEFTEKRSTFIGHLFQTATEEEAVARNKEMREKHYDATHNVYAYIIHGGATTILVSHSIEQVREMCSKILWLHKGRQVAFTDQVEEVCRQYQQFLNGEIPLPVEKS